MPAIERAEKVTDMWYLRKAAMVEEMKQRCMLEAWSDDEIAQMTKTDLWEVIQIAVAHARQALEFEAAATGRRVRPRDIDRYFGYNPPAYRDELPQMDLRPTNVSRIDAALVNETLPGRRGSMPTGTCLGCFNPMPLVQLDAESHCPDCRSES